MLNEIKTRIKNYRQENPERFDKKINLAIGVFVMFFMIVASVNIASVITIFPV